MENKNLSQENISLFDLDIKDKRDNFSRIDKNSLEKLLDKYFIKDMNDWKDVKADLIVTDPPFGIEFSGKNGKVVFKHLLDFYLNTDGLTQDIEIRMWWKNKKNKFLKLNDHLCFIGEHIT